MLRVQAHSYLQLGGLIREAQTIFHFVEAERESGVAMNDPPVLTADEEEELNALLKKLVDLCADLDLSVSQQLITQSQKDPPKTSRELNILANAVVAELKGQLFLFVPHARAQYFDMKAIMSERAKTAFPRVSGEIISAGNCFALGQFTACVFHSMRAAEVGVWILGKSLKVKFPGKSINYAEWAQILDQVESNIRAIGQKPKNAKRDRDRTFYSAAAVQLRYFKDAWRVHVAHARHSYEEAEALKVLNHARDFFEMLSDRLSE